MKKQILILAIFIVSVFTLIYSCKKDETSNLKGNVEGIISNSITNEPVQGVSVTISPSNASAITGNDGKYNFNDLALGDYTIQASKQGFQSNTKTVNIIGEQTRKCDISILPNTPSLSVNLTNVDFGSNLTTLPIEIKNSGAGTLQWSIVENITWISINPISGSTTTETDAINVLADRTGLSQGTYNQSFSITSNGGNATITVSLIIANPNAPTVTCANAINISQSTAEVSGNITNIGSTNVTQRGHCWSTTPNPTTSNNITTLGPTSATGSFTSNISGLQPNTTYYIRAYATNSNGTGYSTDQVFTTTPTATVPSLTCNAASNISQTTADITGAITNLGSGNATQYGHCWNTSPNPTVSNFKTTLGTMATTGSYNSNLSNLTLSTTYYVKAYATNNVGTGYSNEVSFLTSGADPYIISNGLISFYKFDNQNATDELGTFNGVPYSLTYSTNTPSGSGNSAIFDGVSSYLGLGQNPFYGLSAMSINFWIKTSSSSFYIIGEDPEHTNCLKFYLSSGILTGSFNFTNNISSLALNNQWHMITILKNSAYNTKLYIDANLIQSTTCGTYSWANSGLVIGRRSPVYGTNFFSGSMDNIRIYNRDLSQTEIQQIYNGEH
ncbi:MAG: LamG-like jellyroll fold domain-containing protein [Bacteroidia bacterium]